MFYMTTLQLDHHRIQCWIISKSLVVGPFFTFKCTCRKFSGPIVMCYVCIFCFILRCFHWILELFRQCFCYSFYYITIFHLKLSTFDFLIYFNVKSITPILIVHPLWHKYVKFITISVRVEGPSWSWSYGSWIYNCLFNQCLSPLTLWVNLANGEVRSIQHYVIKFVSDLQQVGVISGYSDFLRQ